MINDPAGSAFRRWLKDNESIEFRQAATFASINQTRADSINWLTRLLRA